MDRQRSELLERRNQRYVELLNISKRQVHHVHNEDWLEDLDGFLALMGEWAMVRQELDKLNEQIVVEGLSPNELENYNEAIRPSVIEAMDNQQFVEQKFQDQFLELSKSMKSVRDQQTVLQAYYGTRRTEFEPIYFDEKK
ncbi:hypothetical protein EJP82_21150 [Paenibacillus anaericanus]|uniref:Flagellar protein FliT n=1 Tax=Paenibacillus anaericanus TaxID=170367 RepID=A0A3S1BK09_9BACL|nr:hypothetical protein [Paenibacillus anaericanus]RUT42988.1 hypothetical protein EJP82_21150 [Paenibacillus anaericanus]